MIENENIKRKRGRQPSAVNFWDRAVKNEATGCLEWQRGFRPKGYGVVTIDGKTWTAHRRAYFLVHGEIPKGMCVCHKCDNRKCINPDHLFLGTNEDNIRDMERKGRRFMKLTHADREIIRAIKYDKDSGVTYRSVAKLFRVDPATVREIVLWLRKYSKY